MYCSALYTVQYSVGVKYEYITSTLHTDSTLLPALTGPTWRPVGGASDTDCGALGKQPAGPPTSSRIRRAICGFRCDDDDDEDVLCCGESRWSVGGANMRGMCCWCCCCSADMMERCWRDRHAMDIELERCSCWCCFWATASAAAAAAETAACCCCIESALSYASKNELDGWSGSCGGAFWYWALQLYAMHVASVAAAVGANG